MKKQIIITILNFILFPTAFWVMSAVFSLGWLPSIIGGLGTFALATWLNRVENITGLKILVVAILGIFAALIFSKIGFNVLTENKTIISVQALFLSSLLIFASFVYYLLLTQIEVKNVANLDWRLNQVLLRPSVFLCLLVATILSILQLLLVAEFSTSLSWIAPKLLERGIIPPLTLILFNWGLLILFGKWLILLKELKRAKSSLLLIIEAEYAHDFWDKVWLKSESFYTLPSYINYALPVLGFIGTVLGISLSAEGIANIIASPEGLSAANHNLGDAIAPLGIAFDTTLIALSLGLILTLIFVLLQSMEARILNELKNLSDAPS